MANYTAIGREIWRGNDLDPPFSEFGVQSVRFKVCDCSELVDAHSVAQLLCLGESLQARIADLEADLRDLRVKIRGKAMYNIEFRDLLAILAGGTALALIIGALAGGL